MQALGSPIAVGQGWSSTGMWGTGCSWAALWGAEPSCQELLRASPHSLLCGCWAQPLGLVKQQARSRLGKRGTGESLNKEFLIWSRLGPVFCFLPHPAVLGSAPCPTSASHPWGASPLFLPQQLLRAPVLGLRAPLHGPGLSLCPYPSAVLCSTWGAKTEQVEGGAPECVRRGSRRRAGISPGGSRGGISHSWVSSPQVCSGVPGGGGIGHEWVSRCKGQPRRRAPGRGVVAAGGAGRGGGVM